jgi:hypothetical protein
MARATRHYVIEGLLNKEPLSGTYDCGSLKGHFILTRLAARTV